MPHRDSSKAEQGTHTHKDTLCEAPALRGAPPRHVALFVPDPNGVEEKKTAESLLTGCSPGPAVQGSGRKYRRALRPPLPEPPPSPLTSLKQVIETSGTQRTSGLTLLAAVVSAV